jgi:hypothetical protein
MKRYNEMSLPSLMTGAFQMPMNEIMLWVSFVRDLGLIVGVPVLIGVGMKLYTQQIELLKARNELLKETQYDRAVTLLKSQKETFLIERSDLENKLTAAAELLSKKDAELSQVVQALTGLHDAARAVIDGAIELNGESLDGMSEESRQQRVITK